MYPLCQYTGSTTGNLKHYSRWYMLGRINVASAYYWGEFAEVGPVVTIVGMFGPLLRVILLPVPWQGGPWGVMGGGGYHQEEQVGEVNTLLSITGSGEDTLQNLLQFRTEEIRYKWWRSPIVLSQTLQKASWLLMSKLNQSISIYIFVLAFNIYWSEHCIKNKCY